MIHLAKNIDKYRSKINKIEFCPIATLIQMSQVTMMLSWMMRQRKSEISSNKRSKKQSCASTGKYYSVILQFFDEIINNH
jgi:hypothetical protein